VLDGGHVVFATIAKLRGKPLNPVWMQNAVAACFVLLIGLIIYVSYNDIRRLIHYRFDDTPAQPAEPEKSPEQSKP
jgi:regulator of sigma E protease